MTNLPLPATTRAAAHPLLPAAELTAVVRLYGVRQGVEQGYQQVKQELGWGDFPVRADRAIRRHGALVCGAFCFCWWAQRQQDHGDGDPAHSRPLPQAAGAGEKWGPGACGARTDRTQWRWATAVLAPGAAAGAELA